MSDGAACREWRRDRPQAVKARLIADKAGRAESLRGKNWKVSTRAAEKITA